MSAPEVWITGLGALSSVGKGTAALLAAMREGRSGVRPVVELAGAPAGQVEEAPTAGPARRLDRSGAHFFAAAEEAWEDAGLADKGADPRRIGVCEGSSLGPMAAVLEGYGDVGRDGRARVRPSALVRCMMGAGGATFAQAHGLDGPVLHVSAGSVSAAGAIGEAFEWIRRGRADVVVAGGGECPLHPLVLEHFRAAGVLSPVLDGVPACRPFDAERDGTVFGEGAGALVLEAAAHARRRGAGPRARLLGYGFACEPYSIVAPDPRGIAVAVAVRRAEAGAERPPGWVKCHGTATRAGDAAECRGLAAGFGSDFPSLPLTGLKPILGHCLGASGSVEAVAAVLALRAGIVPGTLGTTRVDPALPSCRVVTGTRRTEAREVLLVAEGFGGRCAALRVGRA